MNECGSATFHWRCINQTNSLQHDTNAHVQTYRHTRCRIIYWFCLLTSIWVADGARLCVCLLPNSARLWCSHASNASFSIASPCCRSCNKCCDQLLYNITIAAATAIATTITRTITATSISLDASHEILAWHKQRTLSRSLGKRVCVYACVCVFLSLNELVLPFYSTWVNLNRLESTWLDLNLCNAAAGVFALYACAPLSFASASFCPVVWHAICGRWDLCVATRLGQVCKNNRNRANAMK